MIPRPARTRRPSTAQAIQSSVTIAVVGTGTNSLASEVATSQPPTWVETSRMPRPRDERLHDVLLAVDRRRRTKLVRASRAPTGGRPIAAPRSAPRGERDPGRLGLRAERPARGRGSRPGVDASPAEPPTPASTRSSASPCATPVGQPTDGRARADERPRSTRAASGPWPNGASGRGRPSGASRS